MSASLRPVARRSLPELEPVAATPSWAPALLAKGFRPFFLLAALFAIAIVPLWLFVLDGTLQVGSRLAPMTWHAHEMLFGFVGAVLAGFLLTAAGNWTQRETLTGAPLLVLAALWCAGRLALLGSAYLPAAFIALTDLSFWVVLLGVLGRTLIAAGSRRNWKILGILAALLLANAGYHLEAVGVLPVGFAQRATLLGVDLVLLLISIVAGRTFPTFTRNATGVKSIRSVPVLDGLAIGALCVMVALDALSPASSGAALLAGGAGVLSFARAMTWGARYSLRQPLLWILHAGYAWLALGLLFRGLASLSGASSSSLALHTLTVGAIGSLTLGMMARVSLGHTGRMLGASPGTSAAFAAITLATLVRVFVPLFAPSWYFASLVAAGSLWVAAFALFIRVYWPILSSARVDGRPG